MSEHVIRALTLGVPFTSLGPENRADMSALYKKAEELCSSAGMVIRTRRLVFEALTPDQGMDQTRLRALLRSVRNNCEACGIRWLCLPISSECSWGEEDLRLLGPSLLQENPSLFLHYLLPCGMDANESIFGTLANIVLAIARLSNNGFDNFRVGCGANIVPNTPFFPFSWHEGEPGFSMAVESLDPLLTFLDAHRGERDLDRLFACLVHDLADICRQVNNIGLELERAVKGTFRYKGLDISLAPYPDERHSIASLMERLGLYRFGGLGTATCTSFLTSLLKASLAMSGARARGFNGVMFSPLEDKGIAQRLRTDDLLVEHFMLWATLCGCGVDMLPIEGNTRVDAIAALYRDVSALSRKQNKPLGVRVLPIPGGRINESTHFNHDFLFNCRILAVRGGIGPVGL